MSRPAPDLPLSDDALTAEGIFDCRATAALLRAMAPLMWAAHVGAVVAAGHRAWFPLLAWGLVIYFAVRVRLDTELLELLAGDPEYAPGRLDAWLARAGLRAKTNNRSLADRCHGARRLVLYLAGACLLQAAATVAFFLGAYR